MTFLQGRVAFLRSLRPIAAKSSPALEAPEELDLGTPSSVESCAKAFLDLNLPLHALICNAGINGVPKWGQHTPGKISLMVASFRSGVSR